MLSALALPTLLLAMVLCAGAAALVLVRSACLRGMGQRPMVGLSRAAGSSARGGAVLARRGTHSHCLPERCGDGRRWIEHGEEPRSAASAPALPHSSLINRPAAGAPLLPLGARCGDSLGRTGTVLSRELLQHPVLTPTLARCS